MLNQVIIMGRITHDLELKQTQSGVSFLRFNVAVDRGYVKQGEERQADFISCIAWGHRAEFINDYFSKGRMIALEGQLRTGSYDDKNGVKHYTTDVNVDNVSFTGEPKQQDSGGYPQPENNAGADRNVTTGGDLSVSDIADFEDIINDGAVPF